MGGSLLEIFDDAVGCDRTVVAGSDDLTQILDDTVAGTIDAFDLCRHIRIGLDIASFIEYRIIDEVRTRIGTDVREDALAWNDRFFVRVDVSDLHAADPVIFDA